MGIQIIGPCGVGIATYMKAEKRLGTDHNMWKLKVTDCQGGRDMLFIPGEHESQEAAMNRVFEDYDVLSRTLDIRGWRG